MTDQEIVKKCLTRVCRDIGCDPLHMIHRDYELVSERINDSTGILISVSTIKRLLNGDFSRLPQAATLNAISGYLGYKDWHEYKSIEKNSGQRVVPGVEKEKKLPDHAGPVTGRKWKMIGIAVFATGIIITAGFLTISSKSPANRGEAFFSVKMTRSKGIPNTVVFNYNIDELEADSFFIQQSWDENRRVRIHKKNYTLTDIYYEPGYHTAKLIADDKIIKTFDISIPTDDWFVYAKERKPGSIPEYIKAANTIKNGVFSIDKADLINSRVDPGSDKSYIYSFFPAKLEANSDNYLFRSRVRVTEVRADFCPYLMCEVFCQRNFMFFKSSSPGCSSESMVQFGEVFLSGKKNDLSTLGTDISQWMDIELIVKDRQVTIFLNNNKVFSGAYRTSSGLITGLGFISNGLCEIDFVELKGLDGKEVYSSTFD